MQLGILGNKIGMTQLIDETGTMVPVTILRAGPCTVTQIKTIEIDGYNAIQLGYGTISSTVLRKPQLGHLEKSDAKMLQYLHEYRMENVNNFSVGQIINASILDSGSLVNVTGKSIGKGFTGLQKRYNFARGPMTHGSKNHRAPGSIGAGTTPGRVYLGKKMSGRDGGGKVTIKKLKVLLVDVVNNLVILKGAVPGKFGNLISLESYAFNNYQN